MTDKETTYVDHLEELRWRIISVLAQYRLYIIILIAAVSAFISPPDVISQILIGVPFYLLFEVTLIIGRFIEPGQKLDSD